MVRSSFYEERNRRDKIAQVQGWDNLDVLTCSTLWLHALAWKGHVRLWNAGVLDKQETLAIFGMLLQEVKPEYLDVTLRTSTKSLYNVPLFSNELTSLTHLRVQMEDDWPSGANLLPNLHVCLFSSA